MGMRRIVLLLASMALTVVFGSGVSLADSPTTKEDCKNGGYAKYGFKNKGQCIKAVNHATPADDITAPVISTTGIARLAVDPDSAEASFTANEPATFECSLRRTDQSELNWEPCTSPQRYENLTDGFYVFQLRATDTAGNVSEVHQSTVLIDTQAPTISIDSGPSEGSTVNTNTVSFGWTANDNHELMIVNCYLLNVLDPSGTNPINPDGAINGQCLDQTIGGPGPQDPINPATFSNLADGAYTFTLAANDCCQNTVLQRHFTVDTTP
jgi:large repetitive protein